MLTGTGVFVTFHFPIMKRLQQSEYFSHHFLIQCLKLCWVNGQVFIYVISSDQFRLVLVKITYLCSSSVNYCLLNKSFTQLLLHIIIFIVID